MNQPRMQQWVLDILLRRILDQQYDLTPSSDQTTPNSQKNYQPNLLSNQHNYKPQQTNYLSLFSIEIHHQIEQTTNPNNLTKITTNQTYSLTNITTNKLHQI